jgi:hypothetical protein
MTPSRFSTISRICRTALAAIGTDLQSHHQRQSADVFGMAIRRDTASVFALNVRKQVSAARGFTFTISAMLIPSSLMLRAGSTSRFGSESMHHSLAYNVRLADEIWIRKEDAVTIGPLSRWTQDGDSKNWREVIIPLTEVEKIDLKRLGALSFEFQSPGNFTLWIDDLCLKQTAEATTPEPSALATPEVRKLPNRAMWVWTTDAIIRDTRETGHLLEACRAERITHLWMQLPYKVESTGSEQTSRTSVRIQSADHLRAFIRKSHHQGIEIHALDGSPEFAIQSGHAIPLAVIDAVANFNSTSKPAERFDGIHFDNEPYLLLGWGNTGLREEILHDLLTLNLECQHKARKAGLTFGVDVPFWWNALDAEAGEAAGAVTFQGSRKAATFHCIDHLDNVGIMNYRDQADGADGILAHGLDILKYGDETAHSSVFMGVETFRYKPQPFWFALGLPESEFVAALTDRAQLLAGLSRLHGLRLYRLRTAGHVHVGIELPPPDATSEQIQLTEAAIRILAREFGHYSGGSVLKTWGCGRDCFMQVLCRV